MAPVALLWLGLGSIAQSSQYTLSLEGDSFTVRNGATVERIPLKEEEPSVPNHIAYRKDDNYAVWDNRGLTLRKGSRFKSFRLEDIPVSPKIFEPEEIEAIQHDASEGKRSLAAAGLSGSRRIGQRVYFLVRWDDAAHQPNFEALIQVDLDAAEMTPYLVGKVEGVTGSTKAIDDRLFLANGGVGAITKRASDWGVASYSFATKSFDFISMGQKLTMWYPSGLYLESTPYETKLGGYLNRDTLQSTALFEDRGNPSWLDGDLPPVAVIKHSDNLLLRNCESGMEQTLSGEAQIRRCKDGILAWSPADNPKHAVLLSFSRWTRLAAWNEGSMQLPQHKKHRKLSR